MHAFAHNSYYGRLADEMPKACLASRPEILFSVRKASRTDGKATLLIRPADIRKAFPTARRKRYDRILMAVAMTSRLGGPADSRANGLRQFFNGEMTVGCNGETFGFHKFDPAAGDLIFWPLEQQPEVKRVAAASR